MSEQQKESEFVKFWKEKSGWFKQGEDLEFSLSNSEGYLAQAAWNAALEFAIKDITSGDYCRRVEHAQGYCDCADMASGLTESLVT